MIQPVRCAALAAIFALVPAPRAFAQEPPIPALIAKLREQETSQAALAQIVARGTAAIPHLAGEANEGPSLAARGWSIVALTEIGGEQACARLNELQVDTKIPALVRTWAGAGRIKASTSLAELEPHLQLVQTQPALGRPLGIKLLALSQRGGEGIEPLLLLAQRYPQMQASVGQAIVNGGAGALVPIWLRGRDDQLRNMAASYLGALAGDQYDDTAKAIVGALTQNPAAKDLPWGGGALWIPGLQWKPADAKDLVAELAGWFVWCAEHQRDDQFPVLARNLNSVSLARMAGYSMNHAQSGDPVVGWLTALRPAIGQERLDEILRLHNVANAPRYKSLASR